MRVFKDVGVAFFNMESYDCRNLNSLFEGRLEDEPTDGKKQVGQDVRVT